VKGDHFTERHLSDLFALTRSGKDVSRGRVSVVIGGGIGRDEETKEVVRQYIKEIDVPVVVDADAIYAFEDKRHIIREHASNSGRVLFTPHLYEFYVLTGKDVKSLNQEERGEAVKESARDYSAGILLKGEQDIISDGEVTVKNDMRVPYLTSGGTGDVLAGIAGTLLSRGFSPLESGEGAAVLNTLAGEMAGKEKGESLIATDVIEKIPQILR